MFALSVPVFAVAGVFKLLDQQWRAGSESIGIALCALLLARERLLLVFGAVGFCALRFGIVIARTQDWRGYVGLLVAVTLLLLFGRFAKSYKPSYDWPEGSIAELIVGLSSLLIALKVFILLDR